MTYKLIAREPTEEMISAGSRGQMDALTIFWAMWEAAPQVDAPISDALRKEQDWSVENGNVGPRSMKLLVALQSVLAASTQPAEQQPDHTVDSDDMMPCIEIGCGSTTPGAHHKTCPEAVDASEKPEGA